MPFFNAVIMQKDRILFGFNAKALKGEVHKNNRTPLLDSIHNIRLSAKLFFAK